MFYVCERVMKEGFKKKLVDLGLELGLTRQRMKGAQEEAGVVHTCTAVVADVLRGIFVLPFRVVPVLVDLSQGRSGGRFARVKGVKEEVVVV